jgi:hypothetical protein
MTVLIKSFTFGFLPDASASRIFMRPGSVDPTQTAAARNAEHCKSFVSTVDAPRSLDRTLTAP